MNAWLEQYAWTFGYGAAFFAGMATVMAWRVYQDYQEARLLMKEQRLLERGPAYDEDADVERITDGWSVDDSWNIVRPVSPGSPIVIAPSPILREPSGGYATVGVSKPDVDARYATLSTLSWLDTSRPVYQGKATVITGGRHRVENVYTSEINLNDIMERIEMENQWQRSSTDELTLSARSSEMDPTFR